MRQSDRSKQAAREVVVLLVKKKKKQQKKKKWVKRMMRVIFVQIPHGFPHHPLPFPTSFQFVSSRRPPAVAGQQSAELICALRAPVAPHTFSPHQSCIGCERIKSSPSHQCRNDDTGRLHLSRSRRSRGPATYVWGSASHTWQVPL